MISQTACFTGHREIPVLKVASLKRKLKKTLEELIAEGICYFGAGGALGFDTLAAQTVLDLRQQYPQIKLILVLPCLSQASSWSEKNKLMYSNTALYRWCNTKKLVGFKISGRFIVPKIALAEFLVSPFSCSIQRKSWRHLLFVATFLKELDKLDETQWQSKMT